MKNTKELKAKNYTLNQKIQERLEKLNKTSSEKKKRVNNEEGD